MSIKDILVHVDSTSASTGRLKLAVGLAGRFGAQITGLHVIPEPDVPPYFKPSVVERIAEIYAENAREAAALAEDLFRAGGSRQICGGIFDACDGYPAISLDGEAERPLSGKSLLEGFYKGAG